MNQVRITVLMPVYNGEQHLAEAIDSILNQTYTDFEFLIINDGSTDKSVEIIRSYKDARIRLINNETNIGVAASLNKGLDLATGDYVARMDGDDISFPRRLEKQVAFMERNPDVGICGTWIKVTGDRVSTIMRYPIDSASIRCTFLFYSALAHPSVIFRKSAFERYRLRYDDSYKGTEDYELWVRAAECFRLANLPEVLLNYRLHAGQASNKVGVHQRSEAGLIRKRLISNLGIEPSSELANCHEPVALRQLSHLEGGYSEAEKWLVELGEKNEKVGIYPRDAFTQVIAEQWFRLCYSAVGNAWWPLTAYWQSPLRGAGKLSSRLLFMLFLKRTLGYARGKRNYWRGV
jgi:glycosyltransferase involved in cell wall biosynthesis